jgi:polyisoprenoid-binding protein YceI
MHGTKKEITIPFTFRDNKFTGSFTVNRMDYGVGSMEGMSKKVSNEIRLEIFVPVTKK